MKIQNQGAVGDLFHWKSQKKKVQVATYFTENAEIRNNSGSKLSKMLTQSAAGDLLYLVECWNKVHLVI